MYAGSLVGLIASVGLATWSIRASIFAAGAVTVAMGVLALAVMPETGFVPAPRDGHSHGRAMVETALRGARLVRRAPVLLLLVATTLFAGAASEGYDRLGEAHIIRDVGLPGFAGFSFVVWFGVISAASLLLALLVARPANRRLQNAPRQTVTHVLLFADVALIAGVTVFALAGAFWIALLAMLATNTVRSLVGPLFSSWLNQSIADSSVRATVLSIANQADAIGQWTGGPAIGAIGNAFGIRAALAVGASLLSPAVALYASALRRSAGPEAAAALVEP